MWQLIQQIQLIQMSGFVTSCGDDPPIPLRIFHLVSQRMHMITCYMILVLAKFAAKPGASSRMPSLESSNQSDLMPHDQAIEKID